MNYVYTFCIYFLFSFQCIIACHDSSASITKIINGDGTTTFNFDLMVDVGTLDGTNYGFEIRFNGTSPNITSFPATVPINAETGTGSVTGGNLLKYDTGLFGTSVDYNVSLSITVSGTITSVDVNYHWDDHDIDTGLCTDNFLVSSIVLPVELSNFVATPRTNTVSLNWETQSENNNAYFEVEHSTNGYDFASIAKIEGTGFSTKTVAYNYLHQDPSLAINYYRLKQVDFDGRTTYSELVTAEVTETSLNINVYPNPARHSLVLTADPALWQSGSITILDATGRMIDNISEAEQLSEEYYSLNIAHLPNGIYFIKVPNAKVVRFIKL